MTGFLVGDVHFGLAGDVYFGQRSVILAKDLQFGQVSRVTKETDQNDPFSRRSNVLAKDLRFGLVRLPNFHMGPDLNGVSKKPVTRNPGDLSPLRRMTEHFVLQPSFVLRPSFWSSALGGPGLRGV